MIKVRGLLYFAAFWAAMVLSILYGGGSGGVVDSALILAFWAFLLIGSVMMLFRRGRSRGGDIDRGSALPASWKRWMLDEPRSAQDGKSV